MSSSLGAGMLLLSACTENNFQASKDGARSQVESPASARKIIFAGLSGNPPRFIDSGQDKGLGWQEYETLEIRKALKRAGFEVQTEYMTPARIEHEFQLRSPICTWPVKWRNPSAVFSKKPDRVYSIPLYFEGDESHSILYRQADDKKFQKFRDAKGDLKFDQLLKDQSLKTLFVRGADYGSLNAMLFRRDSKGDQLVRAEFARNVMLLLTRDKRQLLEMLNGDRFDYIISDEIEDQDFKLTGISKESFKTARINVRRISSIQDPELVYVSIACADHPIALEALPVVNRQIREVRGLSWIGRKMAYKALINGGAGNRNARYLSTLANLRGQFESGGGETWYSEQQRHFPGLKLLPSPEPEIRLRNPPQRFEPGSSRAGVQGALRWYADSSSLEDFVLIYSEVAWLPLPNFKDREGLPNLQNFPDMLLANHVDRRAWREIAKGLEGNGHGGSIRSALDQALAGGRKKLVLFADGLSIDDTQKLPSLIERLSDLTVVRADRDVSNQLVAHLSPLLERLVLVSCALYSTPIGEKVAGLANLKSLDLTHSQLTPDQNRVLLEKIPRSIENLSLGYNRVAFLPEHVELLRKAAWPKLKSLDLESTWLYDPFLEALKASLPASIERLNLNYSSFSPPAIQSFFERPFPKLIALGLSGSALGSKLKGRIVFPPSIRELELWRVRLTPETLGSVVFPRQLGLLDLSENDLGEEGAKKIAGSLAPRMELLDLQQSHISEMALKPIFGTVLREVGWLDLSRNGLGDNAIKTLADSNVQIKQLSLAQNSIRNHGVEILAEKIGPQLFGLNLTQNPISEGGVCAITRRLSTEIINLSLEELFELDSGCIAEFLRRAKSAGKLKALSLSGNLLGDSDLVKLAAVFPPSLELLSLRSSEIKAAGLNAFLSWSPKRLKAALLEGTPLSERNLSELLRALPRGLSFLSLGPIQPAPDRHTDDARGTFADLFPFLRVLNIDTSRIDESESTLFGRFPASLDRLYFIRAKGERGLGAALKNSRFKNLRHVYVEANQWSASSRSDLLQSMGEGLEYFSTFGIGFTDEDLKEMQKRAFPILNVLQLRGSPFRSQALSNVVKTHRLLRLLGINGSTQVGDEFFLGLKRSDLEALRMFSAPNTGLTIRGWEDGFRKVSPFLFSSDISNTKIGPKDVGRLLESFPRQLFSNCFARGLPIGENGWALLDRHVAEHELRTGLKIEFLE